MAFTQQEYTPEAIKNVAIDAARIFSPGLPAIELN
jgi:hypothetical protein